MTLLEALQEVLIPILPKQPLICMITSGAFDCSEAHTQHAVPVEHQMQHCGSLLHSWLLAVQSHAAALGVASASAVTKYLNQCCAQRVHTKACTVDRARLYIVAMMCCINTIAASPNHLQEWQESPEQCRKHAQVLALIFDTDHGISILLASCSQGPLISVHHLLLVLMGF